MRTPKPTPIASQTWHYRLTPPTVIRRGVTAWTTGGVAPSSGSGDVAAISGSAWQARKTTTARSLSAALPRLRELLRLLTRRGNSEEDD